MSSDPDFKAASTNRADELRFKQLLSRRSRWRWGLSGFLIAAWFLYSIGGLYLPEAWAQPVPGSSIPLGIALGSLIIIASIIASIVYVRIANTLEHD